MTKMTITALSSLSEDPTTARWMSRCGIQDWSSRHEQREPWRRWLNPVRHGAALGWLSKCTHSPAGSYKNIGLRVMVSPLFKAWLHLLNKGQTSWLFSNEKHNFVPYWIFSHPVSKSPTVPPWNTDMILIIAQWSYRKKPFFLGNHQRM